ncbi:MAG: hypothetical protein II004_05800 [Erysipelotrichaceae bacterium]|nr:hypothetical protein [Erysipelotrichaceae bacterium]
MDLNLFIYHIIRSLIAAEINSLSAVVLIGVYLFVSVFGMWKVFVKAGKKGWHACVPVLNYYELFSIAWRGRTGILFSVLEIAYILLTMDEGELLTKGFRGFLGMALFVASFILLMIAKIKLAFSFKKGSIFAYGLIFMELVFLMILGLDKSVYLGPTLRTNNDPRQLDSVKLKRDTIIPSQRRYMISLYKRRSIIALIAGIIVFVVSLAAISGGLINTYTHWQKETNYSLFHYFTVNSNLLSATGAAFMIPYAVEGIRKKRFVFPRWVSLFQYSGAICTTLTMIFSILFIFPSQGPKTAFGGMNFYLHIICPIAALILLFSVETDIRFTLSDSMICLLPFFLYAVAYVTNVVLVGEENGGWRDIYYIATYTPAAVSAPLMFMLGFGVSYLISFFYNRLSDLRQKRFISMWKDDATPVEINIEVYGLGRYNGKHMEDNNLAMPVDIFRMLSAKYGMDLSSLCRVYNKGVIDGLKEHLDHEENIRKWFYEVIGTPEKLAESENEQ